MSSFGKEQRKISSVTLNKGPDGEQNFKSAAGLNHNQNGPKSKPKEQGGSYAKELAFFLNLYPAIICAVIWTNLSKK